MKILFHSNQLDIRGTGNAMYAYARYARDIWGFEIHFAYKKVITGPTHWALNM